MKLAAKTLKAIAIGIFSAIGAFLILGIPTALIPTGIFKRMIPVTFVDYFFLAAISLLIGAYIGLVFYHKNIKTENAENAVYGGAFAGILAIACPICNAILVSLLGVGFIMAYVEPARFYLGILAIALIAFAVYKRYKKVC